MKQELVEAALKVIPDRGILVNVVSLRVRQLAFGHNLLMALPPGTGAADIALSEIINKKLRFELTPGKNGRSAPKKTLFTNAASDKQAA